MRSVDDQNGGYRVECVPGRQERKVHGRSRTEFRVSRAEACTLLPLEASDRLPRPGESWRWVSVARTHFSELPEPQMVPTVELGALPTGGRNAASSFALSIVLEVDNDPRWGLIIIPLTFSGGVCRLPKCSIENRNDCRAQTMKQETYFESIKVVHSWSQMYVMLTMAAFLISLVLPSEWPPPPKAAPAYSNT